MTKWTTALTAFLAAQLLGACVALAQTDSSKPAGNVGDLPIKFDINSLTAGGFLAWYAWYTQSRSFPKIQKDHRDDMAAAREAFLAAMQGERQMFAGQFDRLDKRLSEAQTQMHSDGQALAIALTELSKAVNTLQAKQVANV